MFKAHHSYKPSPEYRNTDIELRTGDIVTNVEYLGKTLFTLVSFFGCHCTLLRSVGWSHSLSANFGCGVVDVSCIFVF